MTPTRVYIAGPWWHPDLTIREWHTQRVELLAEHARASGLVPVYVHRELMDRGVDDAADPAGREEGLRATCALVAEIAREGGELWGIRNDDGTVSPGCQREAGAWWTSRPPREPMRGWFYTWRVWRGLLGTRMRARCDALAVRPGSTS